MSIMQKLSGSHSYVKVILYGQTDSMPCSSEELSKHQLEASHPSQGPGSQAIRGLLQCRRRRCPPALGVVSAPETLAPHLGPSHFKGASRCFWDDPRRAPAPPFSVNQSHSEGAAMMATLPTSLPAPFVTETPTLCLTGSK